MSGPQNYVHLDPSARAEALSLASIVTGKAPRILEKDFWVCWCLERLFTSTELPTLVFKGGTSLSKVFDAIDRFSEDVDITVSGNNLGFIDDASLSHSKRDQKLKDLDEQLLLLARGKIHSILKHADLEIEVDDDATIWVRYTSAVQGPASSYVRDSVKIELGARNPIIPSESHRITVDMAVALPNLIFPEVTVTVLAPERTFWEKATILHAEFHRDPQKKMAARMARHYYDLSKLADHQIGERALQQMDLLEQVAADKARLFRSSWARYDLAKPGTLHLVPSDKRSVELESDLKKMDQNGMFAGESPTWTTVRERLAQLEATINSAAPTQSGEPQ